MEKLQQVEAEDEGLPPSKGWHKAFLALRNPNYRYFYSGAKFAPQNLVLLPRVIVFQGQIAAE